MAGRKHLIIGCGSAGLSAAEEIRRINNDDEIKIITAEDRYPYSPTLLPYVLSGQIDPKKLSMKKPGYFDGIRATFVRGKSVSAVIPEDKVIVYADGDRETYDKLLIATGAAPSPLPIEIFKDGCSEFHTAQDCELVIRQLEDKKEVVVLGAGLVGLEVAVALVDRGCRVTVIEKEKMLLPRYLDPKAAAIVADILAERGIRLMVGTAVTEIRRKGAEYILALSDGSPLSTEILVSCTGVKARVGFLEGSGIAVNQGILVNHKMMTNIKDIHAAGDVAEAPGFLSGRHGMNQIIESAVDQGRIAGANMAGVDLEYEGWISCNIVRFFGNTIFSAGLANQETERHQTLEWENGPKKQYGKFVFDGGRLVGAVSINLDLEPGLVLYLIRNKIDVSGYQSLLSSHPKETIRFLMIAAEHKGSH